VSSRERLTVQALLALMLMSPVEARALQATLTVTNAPATLSVPIAADYNAGFVAGLTGISFTVDITAGANINRSTIVSIRSTAPTMGGTKPVGDLQWRRADLGRSNTIFFRALLSWTADPPGSYLAPLVLTLTVTTP
jgi:hypothetical protein